MKLKIIGLCVTIILVGCQKQPSNRDYNNQETKQTITQSISHDKISTCKESFSEAVKIQFKHIPCLSLPVSSNDFKHLPKFKNGIIDLDLALKETPFKPKTLEGQTIFEKEIPLGILTFEKSHFVVLILGDLTIEGGERAQVFSLKELNKETGTLDGSVMHELGYIDYYFNNDELIKNNIDPKMDDEIILANMGDYKVEDVFKLNFTIKPVWTIERSVDFKGRKLDQELKRYLDDKYYLNKVIRCESREYLGCYVE